MPVPKFIFVRHGEAEHNVAAHGPEGERAYENPAYKDAPLTAAGVEQARRTAEALKDFTILDIWSSPLTRAIQTADEIFEETSAQELWLHDNLLEVLGGGHICNCRLEARDLRVKFPLCKLNHLSEFPPLWLDREGHTSVYSRMKMLILYLANLYKDAPENSYVCLVSHWGAIRALTGKPLKNAEFIVLEVGEIT